VAKRPCAPLGAIRTDDDNDDDDDDDDDNVVAKHSTVK